MEVGQRDLLDVLTALFGTGFLGFLLLGGLKLIFDRRKHDAEVANLEASARKTNMEIDELSKKSTLIGYRQRDVARIKTGNKKTIVLREEERRLRGGLE
jgi:hypothetical protein